MLRVLSKPTRPLSPRPDRVSRSAGDVYRETTAGLKAKNIRERASVRDDVDGAFISQDRGSEGTADQTRIKTDAMCLGDNMILRLRIRVPDAIPLGDEMSPSTIGVLDASLQQYMDAIIPRTSATFVLKLGSEAWTSTTLVWFWGSVGCATATCFRTSSSALARSTERRTLRSQIGMPSSEPVGLRH